MAFYSRLADFLETHREALAAAFPGDAVAARRATGGMVVGEAGAAAAFVSGTIPDDASLQGHMAIRDGAMADNLTFLARELYPDKKIIVWAANIHVRHANAATTWVFPTMGKWLSERFRDELYTIGLYPNRGTVPGTRSLFNIDPAEPGTMERLLSDAGSAQLFVDLLHQSRSAGTRWMFEPMLSRDAVDLRPAGDAAGADLPRDQYDGLLFIDRVSAPRFITR